MPRIQVVLTSFCQKSTQKGTKWTNTTDTFWICSHSAANLAQHVSKAQGSFFPACRVQNGRSLPSWHPWDFAGKSMALCSTVFTECFLKLSKETSFHKHCSLCTLISAASDLNHPPKDPSFYFLSSTGKVERLRMAFYLISLPTCAHMTWRIKCECERAEQLDAEKLVGFWIYFFF